jgi:hypothetical protein
MSAIHSISLRTMLLVFFGLSGVSFAQNGTITYEPGDGTGQGKHIVFVCGEWEYLCEESLPMLAKILSKRHGFKCTVLFSINPEDGTIDPSVKRSECEEQHSRDERPGER